MSTRSIRALVILFVFPIVLLLLSGLSTSPVFATTATIRYVTNTNDSGPRFIATSNR